MSEIENVPGDAPADPPTTAEQIAAVDEASGVTTDSATTEPTVISDEPVVDVTDPPTDPAVAAVASGDIEVSLIAFRGGPRDSTTGVLPGHDIVSFETETGETYTRSDQQEGNFRVYTFTPPVGEAPDQVRVFAGPEVENKLAADIAAIQADVAALVAAQTPAEPETPAA